MCVVRSSCPSVLCAAAAWRGAHFHNCTAGCPPIQQIQHPVLDFRVLQEPGAGEWQCQHREASIHHKRQPGVAVQGPRGFPGSAHDRAADENGLLLHHFLQNTAKTVRNPFLAASFSQRDELHSPFLVVSLTANPQMLAPVRPCIRFFGSRRNLPPRQNRQSQSVKSRFYHLFIKGANDELHLLPGHLLR